MKWSITCEVEDLRYAANFAAFEIDDEVLANLREYALANSLFWALAEGHACEQSARRNAMDVGLPLPQFFPDRCSIFPWRKTNPFFMTERIEKCRRHDQQVPDPFQSYPSSCHYRRTSGDHHRSCSVGRSVETLFKTFSSKYM